MTKNMTLALSLIPFLAFASRAGEQENALTSAASAFDALDAIGKGSSILMGRMDAPPIAAPAEMVQEPPPLSIAVRSPVKKGDLVRIKDKTKVVDAGGLADHLQNNILFVVSKIFEDGTAAIDVPSITGGHARVGLDNLVRRDDSRRYNDIKESDKVRLRDGSDILDPGTLADDLSEHFLLFTVACVFEDGTALIDQPWVANRHALVRVDNLIRRADSRQYAHIREGDHVLIQDTSKVLDPGQLASNLSTRRPFVITDVFEDGTALLDLPSITNLHALAAVDSNLIPEPSVPNQRESIDEKRGSWRSALSEKASKFLKRLKKR